MWLSLGRTSKLENNNIGLGLGAILCVPLRVRVRVRVDSVRLLVQIQFDSVSQGTNHIPRQTLKGMQLRVRGAALNIAVLAEPTEVYDIPCGTAVVQRQTSPEEHPRPH